MNPSGLPEKVADEEAQHSPATRHSSFESTTEHGCSVAGDAETPIISEKSGRDERFLVTWAENDPENPYNWTEAKRWYLTGLSGLLVLNATFASSAPSGIVPPLIEQFHMSREVAILTISLFLAGYILGPLLWGPLSEQFGRRPLFVISFFGYTAFQIGAALSQNTQSILIFRFLGGCFAASPLTNSGALIGDIWQAGRRGQALAFFTLAPFAGPALGPLVGGYIYVTGTSWRWLFWTLSIFAGVCFVIILFTLDETYAPILLKKRAIKKRKETGDDRWYAAIEASRIPLKQRLGSILGRPFKVMFLEPMLFAITLYMSFVYGCLYLLFEAYPIVFQQGHGFNAGISGLMFMPLFLGGCISVMLAIFYWNPRYVKLVEQHHPKPVPPEARLPMAVVGGVIFFISFFWFGWTSFPSISYWSPMLAGGGFGIAVTLIFLGLFNYLIDTYLAVAASALTATTVVRSIFGAAFPLFATQMFEALNPRWASTLLGCIALLLAPIPVLFIRYGPALRAKSRYSPSL